MIYNEINAKLRQIRVVVFDIDGTLIAHQKVWDGKINPKHWDVLKQLKANEYIVVLASARTMVTIGNLHQNPYVDYFIGGNGAFIYDCKLAKIIDENPIKSNDIYLLLKGVDQQLTKSITIYGRDAIYSNALDEFNNHYILDPFKAKIKLIDSYQNQISDLIVFETNNKGETEQLVTNINEILKHQETSLAIQAIQPQVIMVANTGVNKLSAIKRLANRLNYDLTNVMAFGDSTNDVEMLQGCAIGVVMKNASKKMYQYGDLITIASAKDGGIYDTLVALKMFNYDKKKNKRLDKSNLL